MNSHRVQNLWRSSAVIATTAPNSSVRSVTHTYYDEILANLP